MKRSRPGGRTAETQKVVFAAAETAASREGSGRNLDGDVATHAGVAASSLYRRWGDVRGCGGGTAHARSASAGQARLLSTQLPGERQLEGIANAKAKDVYTGLKPSIDLAEVRRLQVEENLGATAIAARLGIGRASV